MDLPSRTWSAETLAIGWSLAERGVGMDQLQGKDDVELEEELKQLEKLEDIVLRHVTCC